MPTERISLTIDAELVAELDRLVEERVFLSRSQAVQISLREKLARLAKRCLAEECMKLDAREEQALAELGMSSEASQWPPY